MQMNQKSQKIFPDFYGIGVQKAGTTWLHTQLSRHPEIFMPNLKEIQYFNHLYIPDHRSWTDQHRISRLHSMLNNALNAKRVDYGWIEYLAKCAKNELTDEWYSHFFSLAGNKISGEITPEYSLLPEEGIEHMLRLKPDAKFILFLRHPVERDFSHAKMILDHRGQLDQNLSTDELETLLLEVLDYRGVYERSDYQTIIERWKKVLPHEENLYIGFYDWVKERPQQLLREVCAFLGCEYNEAYFQDAQKVVFEGKSVKMTEMIKEKLLARHQVTIHYINNTYGLSHGVQWS